MRLNYKRVLSYHFALLTVASCFSAAKAGPESKVMPTFLASRPDWSSQDGAFKNSEEVSGDGENDQSQAIKHKGELSKEDHEKFDGEWKSDEDNGARIRTRHALDLGPLNLTPEQKDKIQAIRKESSKKAHALRALLKAKRAEMCDLMFDPNASNRQILKARNEARSLHEQADNLMVQDFLAIRALLSPEQMKHLPEIKPARKETSKVDAGKSVTLAKPAATARDKNPG